MGKFIGLQSGHKNITANCDPVLATETGATGEADFNWNVTLELSTILQNYGFAVQVDDANANCPGNPGDSTTKDFDLYLAIHAEGAPAGGYIGIPDPSVDAAHEESLRIQQAMNGAYFADTGIVENDSILTNNISFYYMWNVLTAKTPCVLIECGDLQDPHDSVILADYRRVALGIAHGICNAFGVAWKGDLTAQPPISTLPPVVPQNPTPPIASPTQANQPINEGVNGMNFLSGYKTYAVAVIMVLYALGGLYGHNISQSDAITTILQALGLGALRNGIATKA